MYYKNFGGGRGAGTPPGYGPVSDSSEVQFNNQNVGLIEKKISWAPHPHGIFKNLEVCL